MCQTEDFLLPFPLDWTITPSLLAAAVLGQGSQNESRIARYGTLKVSIMHAV